MTLSEKRKRQLVEALSQSLPETFEQIALYEADPYKHSTLRHWLDLDLWSAQEGLLILAGVEPGSTSELSNWQGEGWSEAKLFRNFAPTSRVFTHLEPWDLTEEQLEAEEQAKEVLAVAHHLYRGLFQRFEHTINPFGDAESTNSIGQPLYRPAAIMRWARGLGHRPDWMDWLEGQGLADIQDSITQAPFFDADAPDYPELLAIAVRTWDFARKNGTGTPKQRAHDFLQKRYPQISADSRELIARIVNWNRTGGRPTQSD